MIRVQLCLSKSMPCPLLLLLLLFLLQTQDKKKAKGKMVLYQCFQKVCCFSRMKIINNPSPPSSSPSKKFLVLL